MEHLARNLNQLLGRISLSIVKIALIGNEKFLTDEIEIATGKSTLRDLISSGIYLPMIKKHSKSSQPYLQFPSNISA